MSADIFARADQRYRRPRPAENPARRKRRDGDEPARGSRAGIRAPRGRVRLWRSLFAPGARSQGLLRIAAISALGRSATPRRRCAPMWRARWGSASRGRDRRGADAARFSAGFPAAINALTACHDLLTDQATSCRVLRASDSRQGMTAGGAGEAPTAGGRLDGRAPSPADRALEGRVDQGPHGDVGSVIGVRGKAEAQSGPHHALHPFVARRGKHRPQGRALPVETGRNRVVGLAIGAGIIGLVVRVGDAHRLAGAQAVIARQQRPERLLEQRDLVERRGVPAGPEKAAPGQSAPSPAVRRSVAASSSIRLMRISGWACWKRTMVRAGDQARPDRAHRADGEADILQPPRRPGGLLGGGGLRPDLPQIGGIRRPSSVRWLWRARG